MSSGTFNPAFAGRIPMKSVIFGHKSKRNSHLWFQLQIKVDLQSVTSCKLIKPWILADKMPGIFKRPGLDPGVGGIHQQRSSRRRLLLELCGLQGRKKRCGGLEPSPVDVFVCYIYTIYLYILSIYLSIYLSISIYIYIYMYIYIYYVRYYAIIEKMICHVLYYTYIYISCYDVCCHCILPCYFS